MHGKTKIDIKEYSIPLLGNAFRIEAYRILSGMNFLISGVTGISQLTEESIQLIMKGGRVLVVGKRLSLTALENKTVEINGIVEELKFKYVKIKG